MLSSAAVNDPVTLKYLKGRKGPIIDTHNFWTHQPSSQKTKIPILSPEDLNSGLKSLNVYGIGIPMVISQNQIVAKIVGSFDRIIATYLHFNPNPAYTEQLDYISPDDMDELAGHKSVVGFKTLPSLTHTPVDDSKNDPFYETAAKHDTPVLIHCSGEGNEFSSVEGFRRLAERYPKLKIIMAHFGGLRTEYMKDAVDFAEETPHVYLNTTSLNPFRPHPCISNIVYEKKERVLPSGNFFEGVLRIFIDATKRIPNQIVFGTDLGIFHVREYSLWPVYELRNPRLEHKILFENPLQLFRRLKFPKN